MIAKGIRGEMTSTRAVGDDGWEPKTLRMTVNGEARTGIAEARTLLVDFIRQELELTGTHVGCEQGVCGACTVRVNGQLCRSCITFAFQVDGAQIETIEGFADSKSMDALRNAFRDHHGLQCGFCTPGMLIAADALLRGDSEPSREQIREFLSGNICRCTGYMGIVEGVFAAARMYRAELEVVKGSDGEWSE